MREQIEAGDVVQLKSGGPKMTASEPRATGMNGEEWVTCSWFEGEKLTEKDFPISALKLADDDEPPMPTVA